MNRLNKLKKVKFLLSECELFDEDDINIINKEIEKEQLNDNNKENNQLEMTIKFATRINARLPYIAILRTLCPDVAETFENKQKLLNDCAEKKLNNCLE